MTNPESGGEVMQTKSSDTGTSGSVAHGVEGLRRPINVQHYALVVLSLGLALGASLLLEKFHFRVPSALLLLFAVAISSWYGGPGPALLAAILSIISFYWYFVEPVRTIYINRSQIPYFVIFAAFAALLAWFGTIRRRVEEALRSSEAYLAEGQRLAHTGSVAWDAGGKKFVYWSEETFRMFGFDPQDGSPTRDEVLRRVLPEDRDSISESIQKALREKVDTIAQYRIVLPDGTVKHIRAIRHPVLNHAGDVVKLVGTVIDMTDRKRAEAALRESEERYRTLFEKANDSVLLENERDEIIEANHRACALLAHSLSA